MVNLPEPYTTYIDVHGADGTLDLSTALTGSLLYKNREGDWEFMVANSYPGITDSDVVATQHRLNNYLHGKKFKIVLEDDPGFYYTGRLSVDLWTPHKNWSRVSIKYYLNPYKYEIIDSIEDWLWDPFNFEAGVIREYGNIPINGDRTIIISGSKKLTIPTLILESGDSMSVMFNGQTYELSQGRNKIPSIVIEEGEQNIRFIGNGVVSIEYRGGWL